MEESPSVSVVLATYNGEEFLAAQLDSILQQTFPLLEIIVVDDCSTDGTVALLNEYAARYPWLKVLVNEVNLGFTLNFEKGMLLAKGELIAFSDQDDIWHPTKIQALVGLIGEHDIVYANSRLIDDAGQPIGQNYTDIRCLQDFNSCLSFVIGNTVSGHAMLIRRALVPRSMPFNKMIPYDHWLCFVATFRHPIAYLPTVLVDYRQHRNNVFGMSSVVNGIRREKKQKSEAQKLQDIREGIRLLYEKCPAELTLEKKVLARLNRSYRSFSLPNNFLRMVTFFQYREQLLATKKRTAFRKWLFCFKMFVKIR